MSLESIRTYTRVPGNSLLYMPAGPLRSNIKDPPVQRVREAFSPGRKFAGAARAIYGAGSLAGRMNAAAWVFFGRSGWAGNIVD